MTATATFIAGGSVGSFMPTTVAAMAAAEAAIALPLADLQAQAAGAIEASANVTVQPPSLDLAAALEAAAQVPGISVDVSAMAALSLALGVEIAALQAALSLVAALQAPFSATGIALYRVDGEVGSHGGALSGQLAGGLPGAGGPSQVGLGLYLVTADDGAAAALLALFGA